MSYGVAVRAASIGVDAAAEMSNAIVITATHTGPDIVVRDCCTGERSFLWTGVQAAAVEASW
jgi:hypothetical protein